MRRPNPETQRVTCRFFSWNIYKKGDTYYADGRGNTPKFGRFSLGTSVFSEAIATLERLDRLKAVEAGKAPSSILDLEAKVLDLEAGRRLYEAYVSRPMVTGGTRPTTQKRYRPVHDKFASFAADENIRTWNQVTGDVLQKYAAHLEMLQKSYNTQYFELTTLKQMNKWFVQEGHLPESSRITLKVMRDEDTTTYCWTENEFQAIVEHCRSIPSLDWLANLCQTLGLTGMRISELIDLRWSDIDLEKRAITLIDESRRQMKKQKRQSRTLKNKRGRSFPINLELVPVFEGLKRHADGFVFHGTGGGRIKADRVRNKLIKRVLTPLKTHFPTDAGETGFEHGRLHSFRHYFCSRCANGGVPERAVMAWLGHADAGMVRRYYHLNLEESRRFMDRMSIQHVKASPAGDVCEETETNPPES